MVMEREVRIVPAPPGTGSKEVTHRRGQIFFPMCDFFHAKFVPGELGHCVTAEVVSPPPAPFLGSVWAVLTIPLSCPQVSPALPLRPSPTGHTVGAPGTPSPSGTWSPTPVPRGWPWLEEPPCPAPLWTGSMARGAGQCHGAKVGLGCAHSQLWLSLAQGTATAVAGPAPMGRQLT